MIVYGICIGSQDQYGRIARPGLEASASHGATIIEARDQTSICAAYNGFIDSVADDPSLEALVLLHDDVELRDRQFEQKVRSALADDGVAIIGAIGAIDVKNLAWWEGTGRGRCAETRDTIDFGGLPSNVDSADGLLLVLSPWAVQHLRFDEATFGGFHGYDADICFQARAAGRRVRVIDIELFHHTKGGFGDVKGFRAADLAFRRKWFGSGGGSRSAARVGRGTIWRERFRRQAN